MKYFTDGKFTNYDSSLVYARAYICFATLGSVRYVWMTLSRHFFLFKRENHVQMRKSGIIFGTDEDGDTVISSALPCGRAMC